MQREQPLMIPLEYCTNFLYLEISIPWLAYRTALSPRLLLRH